MLKYRILVKHPVLAVPISYMDLRDDTQFDIVAFRRDSANNVSVWTRQRERERVQFVRNW